LSHLGSLLEQRPDKVPANTDLSGYFDLLFEVLGNPSLLVSIPALHTWTRHLRHPRIRDSAPVSQLFGALLETCSKRLVRYEALAEDSNNATVLYLQEDLDTVPERHAFIGNYRRYCVDVIEYIVRKSTIDAMHHILTQAKTLFSTLYDGQPVFHR
jgi:exportin-5